MERLISADKLLEWMDKLPDNEFTDELQELSLLIQSGKFDHINEW